MNLDKMTIKAQEAFSGAQALAAELGNGQITSLHLLASKILNGEIQDGQKVTINAAGKAFKFDVE